MASCHVQALRLCTGRTAQRVGRGMALLFLDHSTRRGWGVSVTLRPLFIPRKDPVPIVQEAGWAPGPVWTGAENLTPPPPGFDTRTVQPVASRYTDWATAAHCNMQTLTRNPLTWKIWWAPNNATRWQMRSNSAFKGLIYSYLSKFINMYFVLSFPKTLRRNDVLGIALKYVTRSATPKCRPSIKFG